MNALLLPLLCLVPSLQDAPATAAARERVETTWPDGSKRESFEIVRRGEEAVPDGEYAAWYENGERRATGEFEGGARVGRWQEFFENGERSSLGLYADGLRDGRWTEYDEAGTKRAEGRCEKGYTTGAWKFWSADGKLDRERTGTYALVEIEDSSGRPRARGGAKDGLCEGLWTFVWPDGTTLFRGRFANGAREGDWHFFHSDGTYDADMLSGTYWHGHRTAVAEPPAGATGTRKSGPLGLRPTVAPRHALNEHEARAFDEDWQLWLEQKHDAADRIVALGARAVPPLLERLLAADLEVVEDQTLVWQWIDPLLRKILGERGFAFDRAPGPDAARTNALARVRYLDLWELTREDPEFWELDARIPPPELARRNGRPLPYGATRDTSPHLLLPPIALDLPGTLPLRTGSEALRVYATRFAPPGKGAAAECVERALAWLAHQQGPDGRFEADAFEPDHERFQTAGRAVHDAGCTGLAVLSFLAAGNTTRSGPYRDVVQRGVRALTEMQQATGLMVNERPTSDMLYDHGIGTLALCEALASSESRALRHAAERAVAVVLQARNPYGGWRYEVPPIGDNDTSSTAWQLYALRAAGWAGLATDPEAYVGALAVIDEMSDRASGRVGYNAVGSLSARAVETEHYPRDGEAMTAAGLFVRQLLGQTPKETPLMTRHVALVLKALPEWDDRGYRCDMYYWLHASQALHQTGGAAGESWRAALEAVAIAHQRQDGDAGGSWDPLGPWGMFGGRVYSTAAMTLSLLAPRRLARLGG